MWEARCPTALSSWQAVMSLALPKPQICHTACSPGLETIHRSLCCPEGLVKPVKRHFSPSQLVISFAQAGAGLLPWGQGHLCRCTPGLLGLAWVWASPPVGVPFGLKPCPFSVRREEGTGLPRPFFTPLPLATRVNSLKCSRRISA